MLSLFRWRLEDGVSFTRLGNLPLEPWELTMGQAFNQGIMDAGNVAEPGTLNESYMKGLRQGMICWQRSRVLGAYTCDLVRGHRGNHYSQFESAALPQQEEPATLKEPRVIPQELPIDEKFNIWRDDEGDYMVQSQQERGIQVHGSDPNEAVYAFREMLDLAAQLPAEPIAPLLGQDEPKLDKSIIPDIAPEFSEKWRDAVDSRRIALRDRGGVDDETAMFIAPSIEGALALTSLAAARKEIEKLSVQNESLWQEMLSFQHNTATGEWIGSGWTPVQMKRVMEDSAEIRKKSYAATVRAELAESSLAEAQTRISELEKKK